MPRVAQQLVILVKWLVEGQWLERIGQCIMPWFLHA